MKIGLVIGRFPPQATGGAEVQAMLMAGRLAHENDVTVFTRRLDDSPRVRRERGYTVLRTPTIGLPGIRLLSDLVASRRAVGARRREIEVLLCFQTINSGVIGALCKRDFGIPFVVWIRGQEEYRWNTGVEKRLLVPWVLRSAGGILVQSEYVRGELEAAVESLLGSSAREAVSSKTRVIPTMVEGGEGSPRFDGSVLFVGRLVKVKGVELLIEAMRELKGTKLMVVGDGPERKPLERAAAGLDVTFEGMLPQEEVRRRFKEAAVLVQPSHAEGMPNTVLEAMAHGLPVVATAVAGVPEIVKDGETGYLIGRRDPGLLAGRLREILSDRDLWGRMSEAGRLRAREYSPERVLPRVEEALRAVCGRR